MFRDVCALRIQAALVQQAVLEPGHCDKSLFVRVSDFYTLHANVGRQIRTFSEKSNATSKDLCQGHNISHETLTASMCPLAMRGSSSILSAYSSV